MSEKELLSFVPSKVVLMSKIIDYKEMDKIKEYKKMSIENWWKRLIIDKQRLK